MLKIVEIDLADVQAAGQEVRALINDNVEYVRKLKDLIGDQVAQLDASSKADNESTRVQFSVLMAIVRSVVDISDVADKLGVSKSTVHRWADGKFSPPQSLVRGAILRGVHDLLESLLEEHRQKWLGVGRRKSKSTSNRDRFTPVRVTDSQETPGEVVALRERK